MAIFQPLQFFLAFIFHIIQIVQFIEIFIFTCRDSWSEILDFLGCLFARCAPSACASWGISSDGLRRGTCQIKRFRIFKIDHPSLILTVHIYSPAPIDAHWTREASADPNIWMPSRNPLDRKRRALVHRGQFQHVASDAFEVISCWRSNASKCRTWIGLDECASAYVASNCLRSGKLLDKTRTRT